MKRRPDGERRLSGSFLFVAGLLVALGLLYRTLGDRTVWSECLTVWPPFVWAILLVPRFALLAMRRRQAEFTASLLLLSAFLIVTVEWPSLLRRPTPGRSTNRGGVLRVVTWNVAGGLPLRDLEPLAPDLCLFQETPFTDPRTLEGYWAGFAWLGSLDPGALSRHPITRLATRKIGPWIEPLVLRLEPEEGRRIVVINARLMLPAPVVAAAEMARPAGLAKAHGDRLAQFHELVRLLKDTLQREETRSAVVCGDFNTPGDARSLDPLRGLLIDVWPRAGIGWGATMTAWLPVSRIDQCWVSADLEPIEARVLRGASDHRFLVVDLALEPTSARSGTPQTDRSASAR